jgi:hypothetical protein
MDLPKKIIQVLRTFEEVFSERVWEWAKMLLIGAILAPGERTVAAILRVMGLSQERRFQNYHRVFNRAEWSGRALGNKREDVAGFRAESEQSARSMSSDGGMLGKTAPHLVCWNGML